MKESAVGWADIFGIWLVAFVWFAAGIACALVVLYVTGQIA